MDIDLESWIERISRLALIRLSREERELIARDLKRIIDFFNMINELKGLDDIEPLFMIPRDDAILRSDEISNCLSIDEVLMNVKESVNNYIKGPRTA